MALLDGGYSAEFRAAAALMIWWAVIIGLVLGGWPRAPVPRSARAAGAALTGLLALTLLSVAWSDDDGRVVTEAVRVAGYLGLFVLVVIASPADSLPRWLGGLAVGLLAVAVVALGSRLQPELFPANELASFLPNTRARLSYPLEYWNGLAAVLALALVALVGCGACARTAGTRATATAVACLPALGLFLTSSRGGVVAAAVGLFVLVVVGPARGRLLMGATMAIGGGLVLAALASQGKALVDGRTEIAASRVQGDELLIVAVAVVAAVAFLRYAVDPAARRLRLARPARIAAVALATLVVVVSVAASNPVARFDELTRPPDSAQAPQRGLVASHIASAEGTGRAQFWNAAWDAFASDPLTGVGAGGYEAWWAAHGSLTYYVRDAHSLFLELLGELGLLGLVLVLAFFGAAFHAGAKARKVAGSSAYVGVGLALLACGAVSAAVDWTWELPAAFGPVVLVAAVLAGPAASARGRVQRMPSGYGWGIATLLTGWVAVVLSALSLIAEVELGSSRSDARSSDLESAAASADSAARVQPWAAAPRLQQALVAERQDDLAQARSYTAKAIDRAPSDWRLWLTDARLRTKAGDVAGARRSLDRARELNPRSPIFAGAR